MGKKLTSWERRQREEEKERQRLASREKTASRRAAEKQEKENQQRNIREKAQKNYDDFETLITGLINYYSINNYDTSRFSIEKALKIPNQLNIKEAANLKFQRLKNAFQKVNFTPNSRIIECEQNIEISYDDYKKNSGSFFTNLLGITKSNFNSFISDNENKLKDLKQEDLKRLDQYTKALDDYIKDLNDYNEKTKVEVDHFNKQKSEEYLILKEQIYAFNNKQKSLLHQLHKICCDYNDPDFKSVFSINLPIKFPALDELAETLIKTNPDLENNFYSSPRNNFQYGFFIKDNKPTFVVSYDENYFPLPSRQQINLISDGNSIRPLTKQRIKSIEQNIAPNIILNYVNYCFGMLKTINDLSVVLGKKTINKSTGKDIFKNELSLEFNRSNFNDLELKMVEPQEAISNFKSKLQIEVPYNIDWFNHEVSLPDVIREKIEELKTEFSKVTNSINDYNSLECPMPSQNKLNKNKDLVSKLIKPLDIPSSTKRPDMAKHQKNKRDSQSIISNRLRKIDQEAADTANIIRNYK